jgi:tetratricopeptide (TPR) repeat protein
VSYYFVNLVSKMGEQTNQRMLIAIMSVTGIVCFAETVTRNSQWKDDNSLFLHDVEVVPNSCMVNSNAGTSYLELSVRNVNTPSQANAYHDSAYKFLLRAIHFNPNFDDAYFTLEGVYLQQGLLDSAKYCYEIVAKHNPNYPGLKSNFAQLYFTKGLHLAVRSGRPREGIIYMKKALQIDSENADIWYNMGIAYYHIQEYDSARYAFTKTLQYKPDSMDEINARKDLQALMQMKEK